MIDTAASVGARIANFGFFRALLPVQQEALWFWTAPGATDPDDLDVWRLGVDRIRELGRHAAEVGVEVSLEMYEDTNLGSADSAARFIADVDNPSVGLNSDLGNLLRLHRPVERWESMAAKVFPHTNFWHTKNCFRTEDATTGQVVTAPAPLELGVVNYRKAVKMAVAEDFRGPITTEHYGGDGLSVSATNREYLRTVLPRSVSRTTPGARPSVAATRGGS